jgi:putative transposase
MKYRFIERNRSRFGVQEMARNLGVSRSGYYSWRRSPKSKRDKENDLLWQKIKEVYYANKGRCGSPAITGVLKVSGETCSRKRVARLMREKGLRCKYAKKFKATTDSEHSHPVAPNLLKQDFSVDAPNRKWVGDITYIPTCEGWLYLAVVIDLYSRKVVGWAMSKRINRFLVIDALRMAYWNCRPHPGLIFHSDRGSQYCSKLFLKLLKQYGMIPSMSGKGNCYDNAVAESFFHTFKNELIRFEYYRTRKEAKASIFEYIEIDYNRKRPHSYLGYLSPVTFEQLRKAA